MSPAYLHLRVATSRTNFCSATLKQQLQNELNTPLGTTHAASSQTIGCVQAVAGSARLIRVMSARFEGRPATIIVARDSTGDTAWVVGPDCSAASHRRARRDIAAVGNLRALVSVHWSASHMRG